MAFVRHLAVLIGQLPNVASCSPPPSCCDRPRCPAHMVATDPKPTLSPRPEVERKTEHGRHSQKGSISIQHLRATEQLQLKLQSQSQPPENEFDFSAQLEC